MRVLTGGGLVGGGVVPGAPISNQLKFHPLVMDCTRMVCVPACSATFAVTVCQFCHPPVLGILTVASTVPLLLLIWNWLAIVDATLKLNPYVSAEETVTLKSIQSPASISVSYTHLTLPTSDL